MKYFPENVILVLFTILVTINSINTIPIDPIVLYKKVPCAESCVITFEDYIKNRQTLIFDYYLQNNDYVFEKSTNPGLAVYVKKNQKEMEIFYLRKPEGPIHTEMTFVKSQLMDK